jgi:hypothetical protein
MIDNTIALQARVPQIDFVAPVLAAAKLRAADTENVLAQLRLRQRQAQANALEPYRRSAESTAPAGAPPVQIGLGRTLALMDDARGQAEAARMLAFGNAALEVLSLPHGSAEQLTSYRDALTDLFRRGLLSDEAYRRKIALPPNPLELETIARAGQALQQQITKEIPTFATPDAVRAAVRAKQLQMGDEFRTTDGRTGTVDATLMGAQ